MKIDAWMRKKWKAKLGLKIKAPANEKPQWWKIGAAKKPPSPQPPLHWLSKIKTPSRSFRHTVVVFYSSSLSSLPRCRCRRNQNNSRIIHHHSTQNQPPTSASRTPCKITALRHRRRLHRSSLPLQFDVSPEKSVLWKIIPVVSKWW